MQNSRGGDGCVIADVGVGLWQGDWVDLEVIWCMEGIILVELVT